MGESSVSELLSSAAEHQHAGRLREAESLYREVLHRDANYADALHGMGLLALQVNKPELAAAYLARAAQVAPGIAIYHYNQGEAWLIANKGKFDRQFNSLEIKESVTTKHAGKTGGFGTFD